MAGEIAACFSAMPVERAFIYFFDDNDKPASTRVPASRETFQPKPSFHALSHLQRVLGDYRFHHTVTNVPGDLAFRSNHSGGAAEEVLSGRLVANGRGKNSQCKLRDFREGFAQSSECY